MNDLKRLFGKAIDSVEKASITHGYLGRFLLDGSKQVEVPGQPDIVWVRVGTAETDINVTRARNVGVPLIFGLPVKMKLVNGQYRIIDIDHDRLDVGVEPPIGAINSVWGLVDTPSDPEDNQNKILIVAGTDLVFDNANNHLHDHTLLTNIGTNTHDQIDTHIADATLHFTQGSIDHTLITNIGTNSHAAIDTHIADATIHFTQGSIDHGSIAGLADDDHTQYALLAGRSGGQTLNGDTASGGNLKLQSTAHATKGSIRLLDNVMIGADAAPDETLHVFRASASARGIFETTSGAHNAGLQIKNATGRAGEVQFFNAGDRQWTFGAIDGAGKNFFVQEWTGAAWVSRLGILGGGKVGIGTASPDENLDIESSGTTAIELTSTGAGGRRWQIQSRATTGIFRIADLTAGVSRMDIHSSGNIGIGVAAPQGLIHGHDGTGGFLHVTKTGVGGTAVTVIPDGTGDVVHGIRVMAVCKPSTGGTQTVESGTVPGGSVILYISGSDQFALAVSAGGAVTVVRTGGSLTYTVSLWMTWL